MKSNANFLNSVKISRPGKSHHDLSFVHATTMNMGILVPTAIKEVLPSDRIKLKAQSVTKFMPLVAPVMHRFDVRHEWHFVPSRLCWENWEDYITQKKTLGLLPSFPTISALTAYSVNPRLSEWLGIPNPANNPGALNDIQVNAYPFAVYQRAYNDLYRDQDIQPDLSEDILLQDGNNDALAELFVTRQRAWNADLFTKARPDTQKGDPVSIPVVIENAPVRQNFNSGTPPATNTLQSASAGHNNAAVEEVFDSAFGPNELYADNEQSNVLTNVNDLRLAESLQRLLEKFMRAGSRYFELIRSVFGIVSPDSRLQRTEYITSTKQAVVVSEVLNTTGTLDAPQGTMAGHAVAVNDGEFGYYNAVEHGYLICMTSVVPRTGYHQGFDKLWLKTKSPLDFSVPELAHIGEQPVLNAEVFAYSDIQDETFGYMPKDYDLRYSNNRISGEMTTRLAYWNLARTFATPPGLTPDFIECVPDLRIFAVTDPDEDHIVMQILHEIEMLRPIPKFGTPSTF